MSSEVPSGDVGFVGSIPDIYERLLVPLIFAEPAARLADAVAAGGPADVLETAAGTGVLTRALASRLPQAAILATDLNQDMLDQARERTDAPGVRWQQADALALDVPDASVDAVACQFGVMFFPDKVAGYSEARRVLRPDGLFAFNVWDSLEHNEIPRVIRDAFAAAVADPPDFFARTPYGHSDQDRLHADLQDAGFTAEIEVIAGVNRGNPADVAVAFCQGTPISAEIARHPDLDLASATGIAAEALQQHFGASIEGEASWLQVLARPAL
ncbi:class I SAM-dependent methyltransferase [Nocardioides marmorisolisilvae]|uniref:Methyltransferase domain-containing protein n=1 Tax=Nocardioides marmorisolisilvae TaxID=1542737 RepID=A0A3N0DXG4_9ACTN|nr:class I SAM-dependent methyltransferase [Nocardioides marmorisolisilvae]RNL80289.1 methyltransferase domain-containing protein [Nocardioides marmorisolisilvae]